MIHLYLLAAAARTAVVNINAHAWKPNVLALAQAAGWRLGMMLEVNVAAGVNVCNLVFTGLPHDIATLTNRGDIGGERNSGTGLKTDVRIRVNNLNRIFGGGGGGGSGGGASGSYSTARLFGYGGAPGDGAGFYQAGSSFVLGTAQSGSWGGYEAYSGALFGGDSMPWVSGGGGGNGGALGQSGSYGGPGSYGGSIWSPAADNGWEGGRAGYAVEGNALITWIAQGTITGPRI
ncbi:hypothetical protein [Delftia tsuruhatensis]|uniref:hypothetical protein n=1 Tax=Delftia tsuruhatensis TaxID=180282 RepID=UPI0008E32DB9|nr:hypothetical protein [Delftia tsuruhatensis]SFB61687.1 hypothetical protein SAMN05444579_113124 [Delftia tsuruhatensis]